MKCTGGHQTIQRDGYALAIASPITKINGYRVSPTNRHHGEPTESGLKALGPWNWPKPSIFSLP